MPAKRKWSDEQLSEMRELFHSELPNRQVGAALGCNYNRSVKKYWIEWFGEKAVYDRYRKNCGAAKLGTGNPMSGKTGRSHHRHVSRYKTTQGYWMVDVPDWWGGSSKNGKYLEHIIVGCEKYGMTSLQKGYVIHHIDDDKTNNNPDNLQLMTRSEHMRHHAKERWAQRLGREAVGIK